MAFVSQQEENQIVPAAQQANAAPTTGGQGVAGSSKAPNTPGQNQPQQPSAQLSAYLSANAPQAANFAGNVAGTLSNQVNSAQNAINPAVNVYTGQLYTAPTDTATNQQVASAPSALTPEQQASYTTELQAASKVPNSANTFETTQPYQDLTGQIQNAVSTANLWNAGNSPSSLSTAVQPFESANATPGDTTLDALLLSQNQPAYQQIKSAVAPADNLQGNLATATAGANQAMRDAIATDTGTTAAANQAAQTYADNLSGYLKNAVASAQSTAKTGNAKIASDLNAGTLTAEDDAALGITQDQGNTLAALAAAANTDSQKAGLGAPLISLANYLAQSDPSLINAANTATSTQYADVAALQKILGGAAPIEPISGATADQAGMNPNLNTLDYDSAIKAAGLSDQVAKLQLDAQNARNDADSANMHWGYDHNGGQSPGDFNGLISRLNSQIASDNSQIQALVASAPTISGNVAGLNDPNGHTADFIPAGAKYLPWVAPASDILNSIGGFFGFSEGGEVPKAKNLKAYLGAK